MSKVPDNQAKTTRKRKRLTPEEVAARNAAREEAQLRKVAEKFSWKMTGADGRKIAFVSLVIVLLSPLWALIFDRPDFNFTNDRGESVVVQDELRLRLRRVEREEGPDGRLVDEQGRPLMNDPDMAGQKQLRDGAVFAGADGLTWVLFHADDGSGRPLKRYTDARGGLIRGQPDPMRPYRDVQLVYPSLFAGVDRLVDLTEGDYVPLTVSVVDTSDYRTSPQRLPYIAPPGTFFILDWKSAAGAGVERARNLRRTVIYSLAGPPHFLMGVAIGLLILLAFGRFLGSYRKIAATAIAPTLKYHERAAFGLICLGGFSFLFWQLLRHLALLI